MPEILAQGRILLGPLYVIDGSFGPNFAWSFLEASLLPVLGFFRATAVSQKTAKEIQTKSPPGGLLQSFTFPAGRGAGEGEAAPYLLHEKQACLNLKNSSEAGRRRHAVGFTSVPEEHILDGSLDPD